MKLYKDRFKYEAVQIQFDVFDNGEKLCPICFDFGKKKNGGRAGPVAFLVSLILHDIPPACPGCALIREAIEPYRSRLGPEAYFTFYRGDVAISFRVDSTAWGTTLCRLDIYQENFGTLQLP